MASSLMSNLGESYIEILLAGDRVVARQYINNATASGVTPQDLLNDLIWPTMEELQNLYREDRISMASLNLATRLNRSITDYLTARLERKAANGKKVMIFCGNDEPEELGGQLCAELFECEGWTVRFAGGGVPEDEVLSLIGGNQPDLLIMFGTLPSGVPAVRKLIDYLREVNSCPQMQVMCCGGIYKRAEGLAEEIGADLYAPDAADAIRIAGENPQRRASVDQQTVGRMRRMRKPTTRKSQAKVTETSDQAEAA